jgi:hypothetical protein
VPDAPFSLFSLENLGRPDAWNRSGHITRHEYPDVLAPQADDRTRLEEDCDLDFMILVGGRVAAAMIVEEDEPTIAYMQRSKCG